VKRFAPIALGALLAGCAGQLPPPTEADALRAATQFPGTTVGDLSRGRKLYVERCSACHALVRPEQKSPQEWPKLVQEMDERAKLGAQVSAEITRYLVVASAAPR
jgi:hypothetical protein